MRKAKHTGVNAGALSANLASNAQTIQDSEGGGKKNGPPGK